MKNMTFRTIILAVSLAVASVALPAELLAQNEQEYYLQGNRLYNARKYEEAVASYLRSIQAQPSSQPKAYLNCARAHVMLKNFPAAVKFYEFYFSLVPDAENDKKIRAEYKNAQSKAKGNSVQPDSAQQTVLKQVENHLSEGPFYNRQGNGALAYYDVLMRAGYADPHIFELQKKLVQGLSSEIEEDILPPKGQPLPNLDRAGWEFIESKLDKTRQFSDVQPDIQRLEAIQHTARAWEAFYRGDYDEARENFDAACSASPAIPAAHWGRLMLAFQTDDFSQITERINQTENIYKDAGVAGVGRYFMLLRAQVDRAQEKMDDCIQTINRIQGDF